MKSTELYDGEVTLQFDEENHAYHAILPEGKVEDVASATSITGVIDKPALLYWAVNQTVSFLKDELEPGKQYDEVELEQLLDKSKKARFYSSGRAQKIGSLVHRWFETYVNYHLRGENPTVVGPDEDGGISLPYNEEARSAIKAFLNWTDNHSIEWLASEKRVYSRDHVYAGTYDAKALIDGELSLIDFKTSKGIYPEYWLQAACYVGAEEEEGDEAFDQMLILRTPKFGDDFEVGKVDTRAEIDEHYDAFLSALTLYRWKNKYD